MIKQSKKFLKVGKNVRINRVKTPREENEL